MKKLFTLLVLSFFTVSLYAFSGSRLSISSATNANIRVMVDGNKYQSNTNVVMVKDIDQGFHMIRIFRERTNRWGRNNGNSFNRFELIYSSRIYIKPQYYVDLVINRFSKVFIDEKLIQDNYFDNDPDWDESGNDVDINNGGVYNNNGGYDDGSGFGDLMPMSNEAFEKFKLSLRNEGFDDTRMKIAKQVISQNSFTAKQVTETMQQLAFESSKLEIAKFAYEYTRDRGSYFLVNDALAYSSSKQELSEYIESYQHK